MMLIEGIAWFAVVFLSVRFGIAVGNLLTNVRLPDSLNNLETSEKISILIPVRNEAHNISALLEDLRQLENENLEIWVYDDQSTDLTAKIVKDNASKDPRISLIRGKELPKGWKGRIMLAIS
jgi:chlorobactene glucosyltransferase